MWEYAAKLLEVIDADTLKLQIDLGFSVHVVQSCRLARLNAPEITTIDGALAKAYTLAQLQTAINLKVSTSKAEKYGRWLVEVNMQIGEPTAQWVNLNDLLLTTKHAAPYP